MIDLSKYNLIYDDDNNYVIGYKKEVKQMLLDRLINYLENDYSDEVIYDELERFKIVKNTKWGDNDLIRLENNDEEKSQLPDKPIARVKVLVPYNNGFSGNDVAKYLI